MAPLCTRICPPGAASGPRLKPGPVFVASGGAITHAKFTMPSASYRSSSATSTPEPLLRRVPPTPVHRLFLPGSIITAALSPCLFALLCALAPYSLYRTPPRAHATHPATLATEHALKAVATMPLNPNVLALFRLAYPLRVGAEVESTELPYPARYGRHEAGRDQELLSGDVEVGPDQGLPGGDFEAGLDQGLSGGDVEAGSKHIKFNKWITRARRRRPH